MKECSDCGNDSKFTVIITIQKIYLRTYDDDGDLIEDKPIKAGMSRIETHICAECGSLIPKGEENEDKNNEPAQKPKQTKKKDDKSRSENNIKQAKSNKKAGNKDRAGERPTEKQLKYLNDLAELLEIPEEEMEDFNKLSKKEVSEKLTALYKECKRKGIDINQPR